MGRLTRKTLSDAVAGAPDRLSAERLGLRAFLEIAATRPTLYNIVEEARFVAPEAYNAYFTAFAKQLRPQPRRRGDRGRDPPRQCRDPRLGPDGHGGDAGRALHDRAPATTRDAGWWPRSSTCWNGA
jgi:hypothetical protein